MKLTTDTVSALVLPAGKSEHFEWDETLPSFGVRLRGTSKRWVVQYRVGTKQRRESLGDVRKVRLEVPAGSPGSDSRRSSWALIHARRSRRA